MREYLYWLLPCNLPPAKILIDELGFEITLLWRPEESPSHLELTICREENMSETEEYLFSIVGEIKPSEVALPSSEDEQ
jgi:hypothetical protein